MIKIYKSSSGANSCAKAERWLQQNNMEYEILTPRDITSDVLITMLKLTTNGFEDLLISRNKGKKTWNLLAEIGVSQNDFESMPTEKFISFLVSNPSLIKSPILFNEKTLLPGFNADEIRVFVPRDYRQFECIKSLIDLADDEKEEKEMNFLDGQSLIQ